MKSRQAENFYLFFFSKATKISTQYIRNVNGKQQFYQLLEQASTRWTHKFFPVLLRDGPTEQYILHEFDTTLVCAPGINLQARTSWVR